MVDKVGFIDSGKVLQHSTDPQSFDLGAPCDKNQIAKDWTRWVTDMRINKVPAMELLISLVSQDNLISKLEKLGLSTDGVPALVSRFTDVSAKWNKLQNRSKVNGLNEGEKNLLNKIIEIDKTKLIAEARELLNPDISYAIWNLFWRESLFADNPEEVEKFVGYLTKYGHQGGAFVAPWIALTDWIEGVRERNENGEKERFVAEGEAIGGITHGVIHLNLFVSPGELRVDTIYEVKGVNILDDADKGSIYVFQKREGVDASIKSEVCIAYCDNNVRMTRMSLSTGQLQHQLRDKRMFQLERRKVAFLATPEPDEGEPIEQIKYPKLTRLIDNFFALIKKVQQFLFSYRHPVEDKEQPLLEKEDGPHLG